ncbi:hypothetical protein FZEAL_5843 [Fusarium zealandicum]|uniref:Uncharacterized protein n=1 Tax=Fusarium zealandicum TaxID=1053134 RepID=A0A8H4XKG3_9HYPO|nr:hypothetical protein FZEAL_5843 [Fusarium zealandicum]
MTASIKTPRPQAPVVLHAEQFAWFSPASLIGLVSADVWLNAGFQISYQGAPRSQLLVEAPDCAAGTWPAIRSSWHVEIATFHARRTEHNSPTDIIRPQARVGSSSRKRTTQTNKDPPERVSSGSVGRGVDDGHNN